jgi:hypothetical protein
LSAWQNFQDCGESCAARFDPAGGTPADLARFETQERNKWGPVIKATGLQDG